MKFSKFFVEHKIDIKDVVRFLENRIGSLTVKQLFSKYAMRDALEIMWISFFKKCDGFEGALKDKNDLIWEIANTWCDLCYVDRVWIHGIIISLRKDFESREDYELLHNQHKWIFNYEYEENDKYEFEV